jgi:ribosomal protein L37E
MKRTCNRCGAERYVSMADARLRMPDADKIASARRWTATASVFGKSGPATQLTALELQIARATAAVQCPQCGSESFTEVEVPI